MSHSDDPPFLNVGTEVSAKYRGAFCEATIKVAKKLVKCKVSYSKGQSAVVSNELIRGTLKVGTSVEVKQADGQYQTATIVKLTDQSTYTVVFDDGDERTLKRSSLCLKGGRHFDESETLNHLPLTDPENFGTPVMQFSKKTRKRRRHSNSPSNEEELSRKKFCYPPEFPVGKTVFLENDRRRACWLPTVVVPAHYVLEESEMTPDTICIRSFKDGRFFAATKHELHDFAPDKEPLLSMLEGEIQAMYMDKPALERAMAYLDTGELPWDMDLFDKNDRVDSSQSGNTTEEEEMTEEMTVERNTFTEKLKKFHENRGTPLPSHPTLGQKDLNLWKLYRLVQENGGMDRVTHEMKWRSLYLQMGLAPASNSSYSIKQAYRKYLHAFEMQEKGKLKPKDSPSRSSRRRTAVQESDEEHEKLDKHEKPDKRGKLDKQKPEKLDKREKLDKQEKMDKHEKPEKLDKREKLDKQEKMDKHEKPEKLDKREKLDKQEKHEKLDKQEKREKPEKLDKHEKHEKLDKQDKSEKPDKLEKLDKQEKCEKLDKHEKTEKQEKPVKLSKQVSREFKESKKEEEEGSLIKLDGVQEVSDPESSQAESGSSNGDDMEEPVPVKPDGVEKCVGGYGESDRVLVWYGRGKTLRTYEAKVLGVEENESWRDYLVHYNGWNTRYDEWIEESRIAGRLLSPVKGPMRPAYTKQKKVLNKTKKKTNCEGPKGKKNKEKEKEKKGSSPSGKPPSALENHITSNSNGGINGRGKPGRPPKKRRSSSLANDSTAAESPSPPAAESLESTPANPKPETTTSVACPPGPAVTEPPLTEEEEEEEEEEMADEQVPSDEAIEVKKEENLGWSSPIASDSNSEALLCSEKLPGVANLRMSTETEMKPDLDEGTSSPGGSDPASEESTSLSLSPKEPSRTDLSEQPLPSSPSPKKEEEQSALEVNVEEEEKMEVDDKLPVEKSSGSEKEGSPTVPSRDHRSQSKGSPLEGKRKVREWELDEAYEERKKARRTEMNYIIDFSQLPAMSSTDRIQLIQERLREVQRKWTELKTEVAYLDRKKRRARRREREAARNQANLNHSQTSQSPVIECH